MALNGIITDPWKDDPIGFSSAPPPVPLPVPLPFRKRAPELNRATQLPFNIQNPWEWDPATGQFGVSPTDAALAYQPEILETGAGYQQALRQALPSWGYRPGVRRYIESLEQPLLGQYYGAMGASENQYNYPQFADWLLQRPGRLGATAADIQGGVAPDYVGGLGAFRRPQGLDVDDWSSIGETARLLASQQGVGSILPSTPWAAVLADNPEAAGALANLATFDPRGRSPMGQMRQRAIGRAMEAFDVPGSERGSLDWLGYLLGGGGTERAPGWMTSRMRTGGRT
jgi:hypothetical protein